LIVTDFLDEKRKEIAARLAELKNEYSRLEAAASALARLGGSTSAATTVAPRRRGPGRPRGGRPRGAASSASAATPTSAATPAKAKATRKKRGRPKKVGRSSSAKVGRPPGSGKKAAATTTKRRAGRRKGSGTRALEAHSFVREQPGITIPELAAKMGIKQNYLYRVLPGLEQEGKVAKKGRGWHPQS
jgi:hypothetical protein